MGGIVWTARATIRTEPAEHVSYLDKMPAGQAIREALGGTPYIPRYPDSWSGNDGATRRCASHVNLVLEISIKVASVFRCAQKLAFL